MRLNMLSGAALFLSGIGVFFFLPHCQKAPSPVFPAVTDLPDGQFSAKTYSFFAGDDTLYTLVPDCKCVRDSFIEQVSINAFPYTVSREYLTLETWRIGGLGTDTMQTASVFERYIRASEGTGIRGQWRRDATWFEATGPVTGNDSIRVAGLFDTTRAWISITQSQLAIYCWYDKVQRYYKTFMERYSEGLLRNYNVTIDSISDNALRIRGNTTPDTVVTSRDSLGSICFTIVSEDSAAYKPNPFYCNPSLATDNPGSGYCREFPSWITVFLERNRKKAPQIRAKTKLTTH